MSQRRFLLSIFSSLSILAASSPAHADPMVRVESNACFPACRTGYVCTPKGTCVSRCNPPCGAGEQCLANGECALASPRAGVQSAQTAGQATTPQRAPQGPETEATTRLSLHGGLLFESSNGQSAAGFVTAFQTLIGTDHAAVLGLRFGAVFFERHTTPELGLDLGYRARFGQGDVRGGPFILVQPQLWFGDQVGLMVGGAGGGFIEYKHFVLQIPVGGGAIRTFQYTGQWHGAFTFAPTVGVIF